MITCPFLDNNEAHPVECLTPVTFFLCNLIQYFIHFLGSCCCLKWKIAGHPQKKEENYKRFVL